RAVVQSTSAVRFRTRDLASTAGSRPTPVGGASNGPGRTSSNLNRGTGSGTDRSSALRRVETKKKPPPGSSKSGGGFLPLRDRRTSTRSVSDDLAILAAGPPRGKTNAAP